MTLDAGASLGGRINPYRRHEPYDGADKRVEVPRCRPTMLQRAGTDRDAIERLAKFSGRDCAMCRLQRLAVAIILRSNRSVSSAKRSERFSAGITARRLVHREVGVNVKHQARFGFASS